MQYSTVQYSTVQYSTVQYSTVQYSTVQYNTVHYITLQYSTVQHSIGIGMDTPTSEMLRTTESRKVSYFTTVVTFASNVVHRVSSMTS